MHQDVDRLRRRPDDTDYEHRYFVNLCAAAFLLALMLAAGWTVRAFDAQLQAEQCIISGRKDCVEVGRAHTRVIELRR